MAAAVLTEAQRTVLLLEQGDLIVPDGTDSDDFGQPLGTPVLGATDESSRRRIVIQGGERRHFLSAVGGGTLVWGMQAWRFHPDDFRMASRYGVPAGSSLADWPISYFLRKS